VRGQRVTKLFALAPRAGIVAAMVEPGLLTLAKIVGTLLAAIGIVPLVFLMAPGDRSEPKDTFDEH
jgi:hypothetical protein